MLPTSSIDEAETRRRLIDSRPFAADWNVGEELKNTDQVTQEHRLKAAYRNR